eukprot:509537-Pleurochrysis_carterae.AAC.1
MLCSRSADVHARHPARAMQQCGGKDLHAETAQACVSVRTGALDMGGCQRRRTASFWTVMASISRASFAMNASVSTAPHDGAG